MNREIEAERDYYLYQRRRLVRVYAVVGFVALLLTLAILKFFNILPVVSVAPPPPKVAEDTLFVNSGLSRSAITRTKAITYQPAAESSANTDGAILVNALLVGDLLDAQTANQFPASLVQLSASPFGRGRIQLSVVVNISQAPSASGGTYSGTIEVFAGSQVLKVPLVVFMAPRKGVPALLALLLLVSGATVGLAVKWITESLTRLAAARWKIEDLRRRIGGDSNSLPVMAAVRLEEIDDKIRRQDPDDHLDEAFTPLLSNVQNLRSFATAIRAAEEEIDRQRALSRRLEADSPLLSVDEEFIESILRRESARIERLRALDWPWKDPVATLEDVQTLANQCSTVTLALSDAFANRITSSTFHVLDLFRKDAFLDAVQEYQNPKVPPQAVAAQTPKSAESGGRGRPWAETYSTFFTFSGGGPHGLVPWMAKRPRWFAGAASVFIVSLTGLKLQYLDATTFSGELGDWLGLLLWAAVVELSGVSVLDVLSRLGTTHARNGGPPRQISSTVPQDGGQ